jgi:GNAT superfamily N-acetyltransferase
MFQIINSAQKDLLGVAKCHAVCFNTSLSTKLGLSYIKKSFEWYLANQNCFLFHIVNNEGDVIGYCGGFIPQYAGQGSTSSILQYTMKEAVKGVALHPWLLFHKEIMAIYPLIFKNIKKKIFKKKELTKLAEPVSNFDKRVGLVVIGVHPAYRGSGVFAALMNEFEHKAQQANIYRLVLSVKKDNVRAISAYTKQGWFIAKEHIKMLEMAKYLK